MFQFLQFGCLIWSSLGVHMYWPALVINGKTCGQKPAKHGQAWVYWFGDHKISMVVKTHLKFKKFVQNLKKKWLNTFLLHYIYAEIH